MSGDYILGRREFMTGAACSGVVAVAGGAVPRAGSPSRGTMAGFSAPPMERVRLAFIGIGDRGTAAVRRVSKIPGCDIVALCDLRKEAVDKNLKWLRKNRGGRVSPRAAADGGVRHLRTYFGSSDSWKGACDDSGVDVVYVAVPAYLHARIALYAMNAGKHVLVEVPAANTIDDCWNIVETSEKTRRHCMMLENCCYGENELLAWNLCHAGVLGSLSHAEGAYIHNLTERHLANSFRNRNPPKKSSLHGNSYPTHPLGPICLYLDINRGDRMNTVVSVSSGSFTWKDYIAETFKPEDWQSKLEIDRGDINTSIIKTARGRTIMLQMDFTTPRPYSRINLVQGSRGCFWGYGWPARLAVAKKPGGEIGKEWMPQKEYDEYAAKYRHPLWKSVGEIAKKVGGHGGMDFIMDLRWAYCLQNGLPLDMDVYDLASWSSIVECSRRSDLAGGAPVELPDFTRGAWKTAEPRAIGDVDLAKMGFDLKVPVKKDDAQLDA